MLLRHKILTVEKRAYIWNERRQELTCGDELELGDLAAEACCLAVFPHKNIPSRRGQEACENKTSHLWENGTGKML